MNVHLDIARLHLIHANHHVWTLIQAAHRIQMMTVIVKWTPNVTLITVNHLLALANPSVLFPIQAE